MSKINLRNIKKYYGEKLILNIEDFSLYQGDKIGIVGANGSGKSSLLEIIMDKTDYSGRAEKRASIAYLPQWGFKPDSFIKGGYPSIFKVENYYREGLSGGEETRYLLASLFAKGAEVILLDEPTNNLDLEGLDILSRILSEDIETFMLISHNRDFLDRTCNKILEVENGEIKIYNGNYSFYEKVKEKRLEDQEKDYKNYQLEKKRLEEAIRGVGSQSESIRRTPKRMGNSEARLHRMGGQASKKSLDSFRKSLNTRLEKLEAVSRPEEDEKIEIDLRANNKIYSKTILDVENLTIGYGDKIVLDRISFSMRNNCKLGLIGKNGSGKTSLIKEIIDGSRIKAHDNLKIGYFSQDTVRLRSKSSVLEEVLDHSIYDENFSRIILARLLFKDQDVYKSMEDLSGGELVRIEIAKLVLGDYNFLILDEITNHVDIESIECLEKTLKSYRGNILLVSHDRRFIDNIVNSIVLLEDGKLISYPGNYSAYISSLNSKDLDREKTLLNLKLTRLISELSLETDQEKKAELDREYLQVLKEYRSL